ncbi:MAG: biopolymer transporter ExbD [Deltaproteobacteria bacterium]|jgi:biopolymer transport protein ExbD|nr:biopolymer transporter ExbD [Deltaproteobacteria bacterium]
MQNTNTDDDSDGISSISDINVTPFIDVMLVLLIIFMVTAPLMMGGVKINLPKTSGMAMERPDKPLIISLDAESKVFVDKEPIDDSQRTTKFKTLALESETGEVFVRGDGEVKYAKMMELMSELGQAGFARVTLVTNVLPPTADGQAPADPGSPSATAPGDLAAPGTGAPSSGPPVTGTSGDAIAPAASPSTTPADPPSATPAAATPAASPSAPPAEATPAASPPASPQATPAASPAPVSATDAPPNG